MMKKCDVIIPIYNAYDDVIECIESVIKNTEFSGNHLYLINDASPDDRIKPMLEKYAKKYKKEIIFLNNEVNLGFVGTVNRGMKESKNDVLLLNSDTEVTANWLKKMSECAYSSDSIATVTPLSNNATLASVPKSYYPNDLPKGYTLEEMGKLVEECSYNDFPDLPTGHGFCLYIKRDALDKVGYFDEESFGKGYGEENDFCFRCLNYGYRHVLCDNTYILHKESKSFLESKKELIESGTKVIESKYPEYKRRLELWIHNKPIDYIGKNIEMSIYSKKNKKVNILYVIHDWDLNHLGGTTMHVWDLIEKMNNKYNFHILTYENGMYKVFSYFDGEEFVMDFPMVSNTMNLFNYHSSEYKKMIEKVVDMYNISFVHVHHLLNHYFDIIDVFIEKNISYIISLHDFYSQCPLINKLQDGVAYCGENPDSSKCNQCLLKKFKVNMDIDTWRKKWKYVLEHSKKIIVPSNSTKEEYLKMYNYDYTVIEHGINLIKHKSNLELCDKENDIAFIGGIGVHKGSKILEEFIAKKMIKKCKIHLFGIIDSQFQKSNKHFINHGVYKRDELHKLLSENNIKVICLFSILPETFSYTMQEAMACGIPVISFNMGAIAERINKYNLGWVLDISLTPKEIASEIEKILNDKEMYNEIIKSINKYKIKNTKEMADDYIKIYDSFKLESGYVNVELLKDYIKNNNSIYKYVDYPDYSWVFGTVKWRIIDKIQLRGPFKVAYLKLKKIYKTLKVSIKSKK